MNDTEAHAYLDQVASALRRLELALHETSRHLCDLGHAAGKIGIKLQYALYGLPSHHAPLPTDALDRIEALIAATHTARALFQGWPVNEETTTAQEQSQLAQCITEQLHQHGNTENLTP